MFEPQPKKSTREIVRETFTPSRVGLMTWAFAALVMGTVGLASYQFGSMDVRPAGSTQFTSGIFLPPDGPVGTTGSIAGAGHGIPVEVLNLPHSGTPLREADLNQSQIEVLQKEIVGLRRRLSALSEQNIAYSRRIAALEKEMAASKVEKEAELPVGKISQPAMTAPEPGMVTPIAPAVSEDKAPSAAVVPARKKHPGQFADASPDLANPEHDAAVSQPSPSESRPNVSQTRVSTPVIPDPALDTREPVRIVALPDAEGTPATTGSIPPQDDPADHPGIEPAATNPKPVIISPSDPAGRLRGDGEMQLKRSDFGAVVGRYRDLAEATKAWADFKEQNEERMRDLRPLIVRSQSSSGAVSLIVGPFANAADAAVACLHLLDVTELCHPAIYAGEPLVAAADFPDTAF